MYSNEAGQEALPDAGNTPSTNCTTSDPCRVTITKNAFLLGSDFPADIVIPDIEGMKDTAFVVTSSSPAGVVPIDLSTNPLSLSNVFAAFNAPAGTGYPASLFIRDAGRAFLLTSSHIIDFNPTTGSVNTAQAVDFKIGLTQPLKDSAGSTVSEIVPAYPAGVVYAGSRLYITTSNYINPLTPASAAPGTILVFDVSEGAPFITPKTYIITTDYIPSGMTLLADGDIAVTNSGVSDLVDTHAEPKTNSSIDIVSPQLNKIVWNIPLGAVGLSFQELAVTRDGRRAFIGSISYGEVYELDLEAGRAVRTHADPITVSGSSLGSDYLTTQGLSPDDKYLFIASFENSAIYPIDISVDPPEPLPGHFTEEPFVIGFPAGVTSDNPSGANTGAGPFAMRASYPDIIATTGYPGTVVAIGTGYSGTGGADGSELEPNETPYEPPLEGPPSDEQPPANKPPAVEPSKDEPPDTGAFTYGFFPFLGFYSGQKSGKEPCNGFATAVKEVNISADGGFNNGKLPQVALGAPEPLDGIGGKTGTAGSTSGVTALGSGGSIVVDMGECAIIDGKGKDFVVFENAFFITSAKVPASSLPQAAIYDPDSVYVFSEAGRVGVSEDGVVFKDFPCDFGIAANGSYGARLASGCAGITPTIFGGDPFKAGLKNGAGGDAFDLADIGVKKARYVRIVSAGVFKPLPAGEKPGNGAAGFDLDAVAVINGEK